MDSPEVWDAHTSRVTLERMRRIAWLLCVFSLVLCHPAMTQEVFPKRPITMVVPYPAGGPADTIARALSVRVGARLGKPVVVENRAGASGNMGAEYVAKSAPDGYTLLFGSSPPLAINTSLYPSLAYNPLTSFEPLMHAGSLPNVLLVHADVPAKNLDELVRLGRQADQRLSYASAGSGGTSHLAGVLFSKVTGVNLTHVPFKGTAPAVQALLGGHVTMTFTDVLTALPHIQSGRVRALGVTSLKPSHVLPTVSTLAEQGLTGFDVSVFFGVVAPRGLPAEAREKLGAAFQATLNDPDTHAQLKAQGLQLPADTTPAYLANVMKQEVAQWRKLIEETGAKPD